jgi:PAS domain S-box-containing protein
MTGSPCCRLSDFPSSRMDNDSATASGDSSEEISALVRKLHETQQRLEELTGGEVDAVIHPGGQSYLLHEAQEKLASSEAMHRQLSETQIAVLNALPAHIALVDLHGVIVSTNQAWRKFATANALQGPTFGLGQNYLDVCERAVGECSEEAHKAAAGIRAVLNGETNEFQLEYPCDSPTEKRWYQLVVTPMGNKVPEGAVVMHLNITERKLVQEVVQQSEERFRGMFSAAATGIAVSTPQGRYLQTNAAYCKMLGYTEAELRALDFASLTHPDDLSLNLEARDDLLAGRTESFVMEKRYLKKNGDVVWTRASVSATHAIGGEIATLIVMAEDITESKKAENALTLFRSLIDRSPDAIEVLDPRTGQFLDVNETGCLRLGYSREELLSMNVLSVDNGEHPLSWPTAVEALKKNDSLMLESRHRRKNGSTYPVEIFTRYIDLNDGYVVAVVRDITDRKQSEARFRLLVESNAQGVFFWNIKGDIREANDAFLALVGYSRQDLDNGIINWISLTPSEFVHLDQIALKELTAKSRCKPFEKEFLRKDGSRIPILLGAATFGDNPDEGVAFALDLTDRKEKESEVRFNEQRYRMMVEATSAIVWDTPASGEFTVEQPSWSAFTGQTFEELRGWGWLQAIHPDDQAETERVWSTAVANRTGYHVEHRLKSRDGTFHDMAVNAVPILGEEGTIRQWIGIHTDITIRKQSEERIEEQASLLDKTRDAIMVRDLEGHVLFWNMGAERMYGWTAEEAVGRRTIDFLHVSSEKFREINDQTLERGEWNGEVQNLTAAGHQITVEARCTLIRNNAGNPKSVLAVITDITERKKIEQQFLRAQRMESIGTLAGGIAHDLNNILAPIMMSIQLLKVTSTDPDAERILKTIEVSAKRGADIVRQVLSFARGLDGEKIEVQPRHLLEDLENIIKDTFPKNIRLEFYVPNDIWTILGDPTQIHQILLNLCVNARDAMPNGGTLSLHVANSVLDDHYSSMNLHAKAGRYIQVSVADSGMGMPKGVIDKIFEPFFTTKGMDKGTGLGLSTVMAIVKSHHGVINVYSELGKGTTFKVYLPAMELSEDLQRACAKEINLPRGNGETILIVDDEASILTITSQTLRTFGYEVVTATDGAEAVALYAVNRNDIAAVLTDMTMPIMDGPATIRALLRLNPAVKIIAASGLTTNGSVAKTSEMGVSEFLIKPYTAETLLNVLKRVLEGTAER